MRPTSFDSLKSFFETAPAALRATRPLSRGARVSLALDGIEARFTMEGGGPEVKEGPERDPDFTLDLPARAVERIASLGKADVGELGIEFLELVLERDPALKVRVRIDAPTSRLIGHGYLAVLALGGMKVGWWLLKKGLRSPKAAIDRLRGRSRPGGPRST